MKVRHPTYARLRIEGRAPQHAGPSKGGSGCSEAKTSGREARSFLYSGSHSVPSQTLTSALPGLRVLAVRLVP